VPTDPVTVVLVDDDPGFLHAARELFAARGFSVLGEAKCSAGACSVVRRCAPDLVVVDVRLGEDHGFDLARTLTRAHPGLAVVLMSANPDFGVPDQVRACGARAFVAKSKLATEDLSVLF